jgi:hypothetical protein
MNKHSSLFCPTIVTKKKKAFKHYPRETEERRQKKEKGKSFRVFRSTDRTGEDDTESPE